MRVYQFRHFGTLNVVGLYYEMDALKFQDGINLRGASR